ncbi:sperm acrosomal protein fsa-acr.1 [Plakobranchus ocellatus]|uniref:Sperm acrosomal protein fsa-acr.1 n=1 Tax=Plakobranchus ocellatus TaxID=259542 RepID=A0AAV3Y1U9_9GAST|nr:sperm acrosomal protein fsa-acr.1 [Plakobranchus ocellatus]
MDGNESEEDAAQASGETSEENSPAGSSRRRIHNQLDLIRAKTNSHLKKLRGNLDTWRKESSLMFRGDSAVTTEHRSGTSVGKDELSVANGNAIDEKQDISERNPNSQQESEAVEIIEEPSPPEQILESQHQESSPYGTTMPRLSTELQAEPVTSSYWGSETPNNLSQTSSQSGREVMEVSPLKKCFPPIYDSRNPTSPAVPMRPVLHPIFQQDSERPLQHDSFPDKPLFRQDNKTSTGSSHFQADYQNALSSNSSETVDILEDSAGPAAVLYTPLKRSAPTLENGVQRPANQVILSPPTLEVHQSGNIRIDRMPKMAVKADDLDAPPSQTNDISLQELPSVKSPRCHAALNSHNLKTQVPSPAKRSTPRTSKKTEISPQTNNEYSGMYNTPSLDQISEYKNSEPQSVSSHINPTRPAPLPPSVHTTIVQYPGPIRGYTVNTGQSSKAYPPPLPPPPIYRSSLTPPVAASLPRHLSYETEPRPYMPTTEPLPQAARRATPSLAWARGLFSRSWSSSQQARSSLTSGLGGLTSGVQWKPAIFRDSSRREFFSLSTSPSTSHNSPSSPVDTKRASGTWRHPSYRVWVHSQESPDHDKGSNEAECLFAEDLYKYALVQFACCCCWPIGLASRFLTATILRKKQRPVEVCIHTMGRELSWCALLMGISMYFVLIIFIFSLIIFSVGARP